MTKRGDIGTVTRVSDHVLVMAKAPVAGSVKTRLCPPCTPQQAADIAEAALADVLEAVSRSSAGRRVLALDGTPGAWLPEGFELVPQVGSSFNERLANAWEHVGGPGLQLGMDTPQLSGADIDAALAALHGADVDAVLGPAVDGGWWGLGLHAPQSRLFHEIEMSRADTFVQQRRRLTELGLRSVLLPWQRDLDEFEDARTIAADIPCSRTAAAVDVVTASLEPSALLGQSA